MAQLTDMIHIIKEAIKDFLQENGWKVTDAHDPWHHKIRIYRISGGLSICSIKLYNEYFELVIELIVPAAAGFNPPMSIQFLYCDPNSLTNLLGAVNQLTNTDMD